jgi:hypothetical protein
MLFFCSIIEYIFKSNPIFLILIIILLELQLSHYFLYYILFHLLLFLSFRCFLLLFNTFLNWLFSLDDQVCGFFLDYLVDEWGLLEKAVGLHVQWVHLRRACFAVVPSRLLNRRREILDCWRQTTNAPIETVLVVIKPEFSFGQTSFLGLTQDALMVVYLGLSLR